MAAPDKIPGNSSASPEVSERDAGYSFPEMLPNDGSLESQPLFSDKEVKDALEASASTGEFWEDWEKLKSILSYYLKQVFSQYPEAKMTTEQQISSLGEAFPDLLTRLDDALYGFDEGPPFTLQRLCEILLSATSIYPHLSKLAFALEKNLLVTSTLSVPTRRCNAERNSNGSYERRGNDPPCSTCGSVENGVPASAAAGDGDEIMAEAHDDEDDDGAVSESITTTMDMETTDSIVGSIRPPKAADS